MKGALRPIPLALVTVACAAGLFVSGCRCSEPRQAPTVGATQKPHTEKSQAQSPQTQGRPTRPPMPPPKAVGGLPAGASPTDAPAEATWSLDVPRPTLSPWPPRTFADAQALAFRARDQLRAALPWPEGEPVTLSHGGDRLVLSLTDGHAQLSLPESHLYVALDSGRCVTWAKAWPEGRAGCVQSLAGWAHVSAVLVASIRLPSDLRVVRFRADGRRSEVDLASASGALRWSLRFEEGRLAALLLDLRIGHVEIFVRKGTVTWTGRGGRRHVASWQPGAPSGPGTESLVYEPVRGDGFVAAADRLKERLKGQPSFGPARVEGRWDGSSLKVERVSQRLWGGASRKPASLASPVKLLRVTAPTFAEALRGRPAGPVVLQTLGSALEGGGHLLTLHPGAGSR